MLVSFLGFIFCIVGNSRVPGTRPKISTGTRAHEIPEIDTPICLSVCLSVRQHFGIHFINILVYTFFIGLYLFNTATDWVLFLACMYLRTMQAYTVLLFLVMLPSLIRRVPGRTTLTCAPGMKTDSVNARACSQQKVVNDNTLMI